MNLNQREKTADTLLGLSKNILSIFVIGGLIPGSPVTVFRITLATIFSLAFYVVAMLLLKGVDDSGKS